jgi:hypothetical protein
MKFKSVINDLFAKFASLDIVIEPEESVIREAVNKLKASDSKYFDGVKKIVVEHNNPNSPYVGKATGESIIYISIDAIRNQLKAAGGDIDQQALVNEVLKTIGHEVAHIKGGMAPTEVASEIEEAKLDSQFPTAKKASFSKIAISDVESQIIILNRQISDLKKELGLINKNHEYLVSSMTDRRRAKLVEEVIQLTKKYNREVAFNQKVIESGRAGAPEREAKMNEYLKSLEKEIQVAQAEVDKYPEAKLQPDREEAFKQKQSDLNAQIHTLSAQRDALLAQRAAEPTNEPLVSRPKEVAVPAPVGVGYEPEKYRALFSELEPNLSALAGACSKLSNTLKDAPDFLRGEAKIIPLLNKYNGMVLDLSTRVTAKLRAVDKEHRLWSKLSVEKILESARDGLIEFAELLVSGDDFIKPLTNQGVELEFYNSAIKPVVDEIIPILSKSLSLVGSAHKSILTVPEVSRKVKTPTLDNKKAPKIHSVRNLEQIKDDFKSEFEELSSKLEAAMGLILNPGELAQLKKTFDTVTVERDNAQKSFVAIKNEREQLKLQRKTPEVVARMQELDSEAKALTPVVLALKKQYDDAEAGYIEAYARGVQPGSELENDIIKLIAPYSNIDKLRTRISTVKEKIESFSKLEALNGELAEKTATLESLEKSPGDATPADIETLRNLVSKDLPEKIRDLMAELGFSSKPHATPAYSQVATDLKKHISAIKSPFVAKVFTSISPAIIGGRSISGQIERLETSIKKDLEAEESAIEAPGSGKKKELLFTPTDVVVKREKIQKLRTELGFRSSPEIVGFVGRAGMIADNALHKQMVESSTLPTSAQAPELPSDILGGKLVLKGYEGAKAEDKIVRDISSVVNKHGGKLSALYKDYGDLARERADIKDSSSMATEDKEEAVAVIDAQMKNLLDNNLFAQFKSDLSNTIESIVQHLGFVGGEAITQPAIRETRPQRERGTSDVPAPAEDTTLIGKDFSSLQKAISDRWTDIDPLGKALPEGITLKEIARGLFDPRGIPKAVKDNMLKRLNLLGQEATHLKSQLAEYDRSDSGEKLTKYMGLIDKARAELEAAKSSGDTPTVKKLEHRIDAIQQGISTLESRRSRLLSAIREKRSEQAKINQFLSDPAKAMAMAPEDLEKRLEDLLTEVDTLEWPMQTLRNEISKMEEDSFPPADIAREKSKLKEMKDRKVKVEKDIQLFDALLKRSRSPEITALRGGEEQAYTGKSKDEQGVADESKVVQTPYREFVPSEEDAARRKLHLEREQAAKGAGTAQKEERYLDARKMEEARVKAKEEASAFSKLTPEARTEAKKSTEFPDPSNPVFELKSVNVSKGMRRLSYAVKKALQLNPPTTPAQNEAVKGVLAAHENMVAAQNAIRMVDFNMVKGAQESAKKESELLKLPREGMNDEEILEFRQNEESRLVREALRQKQKAPEYQALLAHAKQTIEDLKASQIKNYRSALGSLKDVAEQRTYEGVGTVPGYQGDLVDPRTGKPRDRRSYEKSEPFLGHTDPYMVFLTAALDAETKLKAVKDAISERKKLEKKRATVFERAKAMGIEESQAQTQADAEFDRLYESNMLRQFVELGEFNEMVDTIDKSVRESKLPVAFFDPKKVQADLQALKKAQANMVGTWEELRRHVQVAEIPNLTSLSYDPDRFPKHMAIEMSNKTPTPLRGTADDTYETNRYISRKGLLGADKLSVLEQMKAKNFPSVRPGGKANSDRGEKPAMTSKIERIPRSN